MCRGVHNLRPGFSVANFESEIMAATVYTNFCLSDPDVMCIRKYDSTL